MAKVQIDPGPFVVPMPTVLVGAEVDWIRIAPLIFTFPDKACWKLGEYVGPAWKAGKDFEPKT